MNPLARALVCLAFAAVLAAGCAGDIAKQLVSDPNLQARVMETISGNSELAGQLIDRLLATDSTRTLVVDRLLTHGAATQSVMVGVARNSTMLDGVIALAVQDPAMKDHVLTLLKGMQMAGAK